MDSDIPLFEIAWNQDDIANVVESVSRGGFWAKGPFISEFEQKLEEYVGVEHAVCVNSGTSALATALQSHGIGKGDEVLVPGFTFVGTANAVELVGATPVFVDCERETYGMDPADARDKITGDTAAIMPVHVYGSACQIEALVDLADENDVVLIEDAAEALGTKIDDRMVGTYGDSAALSFCQSKIVATGEGGAILTDDDDVAENARLFRSHGRTSSDYFQSSGSGTYVDVGANYRMPDIVAALGASQMERIEELIERRRQAAHRIFDAIDDLESVAPHTGRPDDRHVYQVLSVTLARDIDRDAVIEYLSERGVSSKVYWDPPAFLTGALRQKYDTDPEQLPVTTEVASRVVCLPIHPELDSCETKRIGQTLHDAVQALQ